MNSQGEIVIWRRGNKWRLLIGHYSKMDPAKIPFSGCPTRRFPNSRPPHVLDYYKQVFVWQGYTRVTAPAGLMTFRHFPKYRERFWLVTSLKVTFEIIIVNSNVGKRLGTGSLHACSEKSQTSRASFPVPRFQRTLTSDPFPPLPRRQLNCGI